MDLDKSQLDKEANQSDAKMLDLEHCDRKSFYGKAKKIYFKENNHSYLALFSYDTLICVFDMTSRTLHVSKIYWNWSATTRRHQASFLDDIFENSSEAYDTYQRLSLEGEYR